MKKILLCLSLFVCFTTHAQESWNVIVHEGGGNSCPPCIYRKMIQTSDGNFVIILPSADSGGDFTKVYHRITKYDGNGVLLWDKRYDFGATSAGDSGWSVWGGGSYSHLLELTNGDLVMAGQYMDADTSYRYLFKTNSQGDSLLLKGYDTNYFPSNLPGTLMLDQNEIYGIDSDTANVRYLVHLDQNGEILSSVILDEDEFLQDFVMNNGALLTSRSAFQTIFRKFDLNGDLLTTFSFDQYYGQYLIPNETGGLTGYHKGLIKLDANLQEIWHTPIEDLFISMGNSLEYDGWAVTATPDGGYILAGHASLFDWSDALVYLIKVDENGTREWGGLYGPQTIGLNFIFDVEPVADGYVFTGASIITETMWLVKVNAEGVFVSTEELTYQDQGIVFPNPAREVVNLRWPKAISGWLRVYEPSGSLLLTHVLENEKEYHLLVQDLLPGVYTVQLMDADTGKLLVLRFVKI